MTVDQAVAWILQSKTREYRRLQLKWWREKIGPLFADQVEARVKAEWKRGV